MKKIMLELIPVVFAIISIFVILTIHVPSAVKNGIFIGTIIMELVYYIVYHQLTAKA